MRKVRHMVAECVSRKDSMGMEALAREYFNEMKDKDLLETRTMHPAKEQTDFIIREINDRWVQFCRKTGLGFNEKAFMAWIDGKPFDLLGGRP